MSDGPKDNQVRLFGYEGSYQCDWRDPLLLPDGWMVPRRYTATMDMVGVPPVVLEVDVSPDGKPNLRSLRIDAPEGGPGITTDTIRSVPVLRLLRSSLAGVAEKVEQGAHGIRPAPMRGSDVDAFERTLRTPKLPPRGGSGASDDQLEEVARIYRAAARAPTKSVGARLGYSRAHAGRLVMEARRRGFLGPAIGTRSGEGTTTPT